MLRTWITFFLVYVIAAGVSGQIPQIVIESKGHSSKINNIHFTPDGNRIISISEDKTIKVWDINAGTMVQKFASQIGDGPQGMLYASALSPDGKTLAVAGYKVNTETENYILFIDLAKGIEVGMVRGHQDIITGLSYSGNGQYLASSSADHSIKIWKAGNPSAVTEAATLTTEHPVSGVSFNPRTQDLVVANDSKDILLYNLQGLDKGINRFTPKSIKHHKGVVDKVQYSPDGMYFASTSFDQEMAIWRADGTLVKAFEKLPQSIHALAFSADSKILVGLDVTGKGGSWAIPGGSYFADFHGHDNTVFCATFSPSTSGNYVVASAGGINHEIILWNPINGSVVKKIKGKGQAVQDITFGQGLELYINQDAAAAGKGMYQTRFDFASLSLSREGGRRYMPPTKTLPKDIEQLGPNTIALPRNKTIQTLENEDGRILDFEILPDGHIAVASDFSLKLFDLNGLPIKEFVGHFGAVRTLSVSADGQYLASGSEDQTIHLWKLSDGGFAPSLREAFPDEQWQTFFTSLPVDSLTHLQTKKAWLQVITFLKNAGNKTYRTLDEVYKGLAEAVIPFATLFVSEDQEWVCWTPKGYFSCSSAGGQYFGWHVNRGLNQLADFYAADQFFEILYRPKELEKSILQGKRVEDILRESGERIFDLSKLHRPSRGLFDIQVITRSTDLLKYDRGRLLTQAKSLPLIVDVYDGGGGVKEVNIYQNDKLIITDTDVKTKGEGQKITKTYTVEMVNETNEFRVVVVNFQKIESKPDILTIEYTGEIIVTSTLHVLVVGINKYLNNTYNLNYARPDAESFMAKLNQKGTKLFKTINHLQIYDEDATRDNILKGFHAMIRTAKPEDVFLFYYAGHGTLDEEHNDEYYLVPTDITKLYGDPEQLQKKGVSATELRDLLKQVKSQKQVILMDACHSGGALKTLNVRAAATDEKAIIQLARSSGVVMIASSGTKQFATEFNELKHGVFTYALLEALDGKADNGDKKITVNELKFYMEDRVPELTKQYGGKTQFPTGYITGNDFPLGVID